MKKPLSLLLISICLLLFSCKKDNSLTPGLSEGTIKSNKLSLSKTAGLLSSSDVFVDGDRLNFTTQQAFQNLMQQAFEDSTTNVIQNTLATIPNPGFISYADRNNNLLINNVAKGVVSSRDRPVRDTPPDGSDQDSLIDDPLFSQVVNNRGELQVENTIYKVTQNGTFATTSAGLAQLNTMLDNYGVLLPQYRTNLQVVDQDNGYYKINDDIYFVDTYGVIRTNQMLNGGTFNISHSIVSANSGPRPCREGCTTPPPPVNSSDPFSNMDVYPFDNKTGFFGTILQDIFGNPHYKYYNNTADRRLKVNFSSKNWLVYSSVGVRAVMQKKNSFLGIHIWGPVQNKDEMRLGWTPIVIKMDIPAFTMPNTTPPQDPFTVAGKMLEHAINVNFGNTKYLTLKVSDVLNADQSFPFLPSGYRDKLNNLSFDVNAFIKKITNSEIDNLFKIIKNKIGYVPPATKLAFINNDKMMIENEIEIHSSSQGDGVMSKTFTFNTAIVGFSFSGSNKTFIFKPAKSIEVISGSVYAVGKLNGEWQGISVTKI